MNKRIASVAVVGSIVLAGGLAGFLTRASPASATPLQVEPDPHAPTLAPGHLPVGAARPDHASTLASAPVDEAARIAWAAPLSWRSVPNPSSMRLATYSIPRAAGDDEDAELSVTRAGGTTEANVQRWLGQFAGTAEQAREETTVQGLHVTVVSITGPLLGGGMMQGTPASPRSSWALLGAIVETPGSSYFFKLLGPASTVRAARVSFDGMISGLQRP